MTSEIPEGYKVESGICWGRRTTGVLEIKFHDIKRRNAISHDGYLVLAKLIDQA